MHVKKCDGAHDAMQKRIQRWDEEQRSFYSKSTGKRARVAKILNRVLRKEHHLRGEADSGEEELEIQFPRIFKYPWKGYYLARSEILAALKFLERNPTTKLKRLVYSTVGLRWLRVYTKGRDENAVDRLAMIEILKEFLEDAY